MNNHDKEFAEQGVFTYKNKWLLVLNNEKDLLCLQQYAGDIIHLTAVIDNSNYQVHPKDISVQHLRKTNCTLPSISENIPSTSVS